MKLQGKTEGIFMMYFICSVDKNIESYMFFLHILKTYYTYLFLLKVLKDQ